DKLVTGVQTCALPISHALAVRPGRALPHSCWIELRRCARTNRRPQLSFERLSQQSTVGNGERQRRPGAVTPLRIERAPEQQIARSEERRVGKEGRSRR